jgi:hypothetical protein
MVIKVKYNGEWVKIPYVGTTNSSGIANNIGSRLCFFPKYKSTEITTE